MAKVIARFFKFELDTNKAEYFFSFGALFLHVSFFCCAAQCACILDWAVVLLRVLRGEVSEVLVSFLGHNGINDVFESCNVMMCVTSRSGSSSCSTGKWCGQCTWLRRGR